KAAERRHQWHDQRQQQWHQHGDGSNWQSAAAAAFSTVWQRHQPAEHGSNNGKLLTLRYPDGFS
ncbi:hypothetical protein, partial [Salmonella sp. s60131]|uniref:hypothetical protein n=1 Tax=Salmonella sp. s60131 TaxID=3159722 RepID=UPI0039801CB7